MFLDIDGSKWKVGPFFSDEEEWKNGPVLTLASFSAMVFKIYMEMNGRSAHSLVDEKEWTSSYLGFILWIYIS